jgi:hypothetical protein
MLRDLARDVFTAELSDQSEALETREELEHGALDTDEAQRMIIPDDEDDGMMLCTHIRKPQSSSWNRGQCRGQRPREEIFKLIQ